MQSITILGATGSIGVSTLDVIARHPDRYRVFALTAHSRVEDLAEQCIRFKPEVAVVGSALAALRQHQKRYGKPRINLVQRAEPGTEMTRFWRSE